MTHECKLESKYFDLIKSGTKTIEIRVNDDKRKLFKVGDCLEFVKLPDKTEKLSTTIVALRKYNSFEEMIKHESPKNIGMDGLSPNEIIKIYRSFYNKQDESQGVLAIEINKR